MRGKLYKALGVAAIAVVVAAMAFGAGTAAEKEKKKAEAACRTIKVEADCKARETCSWVAASIDKKSGKEKRRAYCRTKPKSKKT